LIECHGAGLSASDLTSRVSDRTTDQLFQDSHGCSPILYFAGCAAPEFTYCIGGEVTRDHIIDGFDKVRQAIPPFWIYST
jgi:hypothetical protein